MLLSTDRELTKEKEHKMECDSKWHIFRGIISEVKEDKKGR